MQGWERRRAGKGGTTVPTDLGSSSPRGGALWWASMQPASEHWVHWLIRSAREWALERISSSRKEVLSTHMD